MNRFEPISTENIHFESHGNSTQVAVMRDTVTGVLYVLFREGNAGGLTPLVGVDGKPLVYFEK